MTEYTTYVAFDGRKFYDEDDCLAYERMMQATDCQGEIFFYGADRNPIPLHVEDIEDVYFVDIKTEKAHQWFIDRSEYSGASHPWTDYSHREEEFPLTGFFWFDNDNNIWRCWQVENRKLNEIRSYFQLSGED